MSINMYVPILKTKGCEFTAISHLTDIHRRQLTPLFEIRRKGQSEERRKMTDDVYFSNICSNLLSHWPLDETCIIDLYQIPVDLRLDDGATPLSFILSALTEGGLSFIPTIGLDRHQLYNDEILGYLKEHLESEICVRLDRNDLSLPKDTARKIAETLARLGRQRHQAHLLIDFRFLYESDLDPLVDLIAALTAEIEIGEWATFTIAGTSIPEDVSGLSKTTANIIERKEHSLWKLLRQSEGLIGRLARYADYAVVHPDKGDAIVPPTKISTKIRYTTDDSWIIWRGSMHAQTAPRRAEFQVLAKNMVREHGFRGETFSWGDATIVDCANGRNEFCAPAKWLEIDINHHLVHVIEHLASLPASA